MKQIKLILTSLSLSILTLGCSSDDYQQENTEIALNAETKITDNSSNPSPYLKEGHFQVETETNNTIVPNLLIHRPISKAKGPYPIMIFHQGGAEGSGPESYDVFMKHLASYGYVVVVQTLNFPLENPFKSTLDWIEQQVASGEDKWAGYADTSKVIVGGHSLGGGLASAFIVDQPERAAGIVYFGSNAAPASVHNLTPFLGKVLMIGGTEDEFVTPEEVTETFERFTNASCKTKVSIEGVDHGAFGVYERDPAGSIGREKATEAIRHFFVSFMEASFKGDKRAALYLLNPYLHPSGITISEFDSSCRPFNTTDLRLHDIWVLEVMNGKKGADLHFDGAERPIIEINTRTNSFLGSAWCNTITGKLFFEKELLQFTNVDTTQMVCPTLEAETEFLETLQRVTCYTIKDLRLYLAAEDSENALVFRKIGR